MLRREVYRPSPPSLTRCLAAPHIHTHLFLFLFATHLRTPTLAHPRFWALCSYTYEEYLLSPEQVGIPNSRLRYYLLAELGGRFAASSDVSSTLPTAAAAAAAAVTCNPQAHRITSSMDLPRYPVNAIADYLEQALLVNPEQAKPHFLDARTLCRLTRIMDIVNAESRRSMCFTKGYGHFAEVGEPDMQSRHPQRVKKSVLGFGGFGFRSQL